MGSIRPRSSSAGWSGTLVSTVHFTPTGATWLNLVERFFAALTEKQLRRGVHRSTRELETAIYRYIEHRNHDPKPFVWTKTADQILASIARFCQRIFGWTFQDMGRDFTLWSPPGGGTGGGIYKVLPTKFPLRAYIEVEDIDGKLQEIRTARGKVVKPKEEVPNYGWWAVFSDPQGCVLYLWQSARRARSMPS